ncbi:LysE family translocator [Roseobacter sp. HKCCA0434]|uniref:LysE family translocator n=1 Tax=Roseobacter sp. HKCCA0434 TaxID=3079297 RepID=UPI002905D375|nr:LysE family transporter [Roseobacter sp. HKCCA0434]
MSTEAALLLAGFWATHLIAVASPGPSFVIVSRMAAGGSARAGVMVAVGLTLGTLVWALAAWFGLGALFAAVPALYGVVKGLAALFLLYLAWQTLRHAHDPLPLADAPSRHGDAAALRLGLLTQLANPKVAVFFGSIFVAILPPDPGVGMLLAIFAIVCLNEFAWYAAVALVLSRPAIRARYIRAKAAIDRGSAAVLAGLGIGILLRE